MEVLQSDDILRDEILNDAKKKAERIIKKANQDREDVIEQSQSQVTELESSLKKNTQKEIENFKRLHLSSVDIEVNKKNVEYCGQFVSSVFDQVYQEIMNSKDKALGYEKIMIYLLENAAHEMDSESYSMKCSEKALSLMEEKKLKSLVLNKKKITSVEKSSIKDGLVLYTANQKRACHISIKGFINELMNNERKNIYDILMSGKKQDNKDEK